MQEVETLIRARYPVIYLVTFEESKTDRVLARIAGGRNKKSYGWSFTQGIHPLIGAADGSKSRTSATKDPLAALDQVMASNEAAIFVFKDLHPFLTKTNFAVVRKLREVIYALKNTYKTLIVVSPVLELPTELEKDVAVLHLPLPSAQEFSELLDRISAEVKDNPNVKVRLEGGARERMLDAALGLTLGEAENVFARAIVADGVLDGNDVSAILDEKRQIIGKSGLLEYYEAKEQFGDVGGLENLKAWLGKRAHAFSSKARAFGLPAPRGILLLGVQGCGKSLSAKAVARQWQLPLLRFDVGRMFGSLVGSSEENMRKAIQVAESVAPAILWVDEIDKAFAGVADSGASDAGTSSSVFGTFLTWLSEKRSSVFVMATANNVSHLPPELLRKGRLDEIFFVDLPNRSEREEIFRIHVRKRGRSPDKFDVARLAASSSGFSGAEIEEAVISALYDAFHENRDITTEGVLTSLAETVPLSRTMQEEIDRLREWAGARARRASPQDDSLNGASSERKLEV